MSHFLDTLSGHIERISFYNEENGFCVLKVRVKGHKDLVTIVGTLATVRIGEWVEAKGTWIQDRQYGQQFKADCLHLTPPTSLEGIEKYLGSGLIKGIGPVYAKMLVQAFKHEIFDIIEHSPDALQTIPGIGPQRREQILHSWADQKAIRSIMLFLHAHGISTTRAVRIYRVYGNNAVALITENPYRLTQEIKGIGFVQADKIALSLGVEKESLARAQAGLHYTLQKAQEEGHCGLPKVELISSATALLHITESLLHQALDLELEHQTLSQGWIEDHLCIFLTTLYQAEQTIAEKIKNLQSLPLPWPVIDVTSALQKAQEQNGMPLSLSQEQALSKILSSKVFLLTGGPGVGKTTLLKTLLHILSQQQLTLTLCAPTGRAAKRMTEATGFEAKTIHRLLNLHMETEAVGREALLECDVVIVDEVSMVDVPLMAALLQAIPLHAALILVGDPDQLPSVGPGQVLTDLLTCQNLPSFHLTETFRQTANSQIIEVARQLNQGFLPALHYGSESDFFFIEEQDPGKALKMIVDLVVRRLPNKYGYHPFSDIQVLSPLTRGMVGTKTLNTELQLALNPPTQDSLQKFGIWYSVGDKVMQMENNYQKEIFNGDIGIIIQIDTEESEVIVNFEGKSVTYDIQELDELTLAYAMTIHKSQGSEYPVVIIPLLSQHYPMLQKNLVYTGLTRGKKLVIMVGQKRALATAVHNKKIKRRWSLLNSLLKKSSIAS